MRLLITGATGFIGGHLVEFLKNEGYQVEGIIRNPKKAGLLESLAIPYRVADITDKHSLNKAVSSDFDAVINTIAPVTNQGSWEFFRKINVEGTKNLADAMMNAGLKRLIHISTVGIYGQPAVNGTEDLVPNARICGVLDTLEYLHKGGRIGRAKKILGTLLKKKPLIQVKDGFVDSFGTIKNHDEGFKGLMNIAPKVCDVLKFDTLWVGYTDNRKLAEKVEAAVRKLPNAPKNIRPVDIGPSVGAHIGPQASTKGFSRKRSNVGRVAINRHV